MSNKKGTKRQIIEIEDPGQEQNLGQRESGRARRSNTTFPVLTRQDRPSSSGLQPAATRSNGTGAIATRANDENIHSPAASGAALGRAANGTKTSTGGRTDQDTIGGQLSSHIMTPIGDVDSSDTSLSNRMDEWISR